ncbi:isochorismatase family protein [Granulosicoccus sp. 3-233]|uniref:isochorismatase family protein n=1 Tax=Granulosicoccus sp. 3-233 TaxID=3417969 RepID=UPI003D350709
MLMDRETSLLLIVDVQEKLAASILDIDPLVAVVDRLIDVADLLNVPVCASEHFPAAIGATLAPLREKLRNERVVQKVHFSAALEDDFQALMKHLQPKQILVCGTEAHVCVLQTVLMLQAQGFDTFLITDASSSRHASDRDAAFQRAARQGVQLVTSEMVMFEWMQRADIPEFREVLRLIKSRA